MLFVTALGLSGVLEEHILNPSYEKLPEYKVVFHI